MKKFIIETFMIQNATTKKIKDTVKSYEEENSVYEVKREITTLIVRGNSNVDVAVTSTFLPSE